MHTLQFSIPPEQLRNINVGQLMEILSVARRACLGVALPGGRVITQRHLSLEEAHIPANAMLDVYYEKAHEPPALSPSSAAHRAHSGQALGHAAAHAAAASASNAIRIHVPPRRHDKD